MWPSLCLNLRVYILHPTCKSEYHQPTGVSHQGWVSNTKRLTESTVIHASIADNGTYTAVKLISVLQLSTHLLYVTLFTMARDWQSINQHHVIRESMSWKAFPQFFKDAILYQINFGYDEENQLFLIIPRNCTGFHLVKFFSHLEERLSSLTNGDT